MFFVQGYWLWQKTPWTQYNFQPWQDWPDGGAVFVLHSEQFTEISLVISNLDSDGDGSSFNDGDGGTLSVQYPNAVDPDTRKILGWGTAQIIADETDNLSNFDEPTNAKSIRWEYPTDWKRAATYVEGEGQFFGKTLLKNGESIFVIKLIWTPRNGDESVNGPFLNDLKLATWIEFDVDANTAVIPGWDARNDVDGNSYVDDVEFLSMVNPRASARFRHEARAVPLGEMWSETSSWCRINAFNPDAGLVWSTYLHDEWGKQGVSGAYNDDMIKLVGRRTFTLSTAGTSMNWTS